MELPTIPKLEFYCSEHGKQEIIRAQLVYSFGGFLRITLACGCMFDCWNDNKFSYVGRTEKTHESV